MSLEAFQRALAGLVMSRAFRTAVLDDPALALVDYDLDAREQRRLVAIAGQPGLQVGSTIHRSFRLSAFASRLPLTCKLLGSAGMVTVFGAYWASNLPRNLYYNQEVRRFGAFVLEQIAQGALAYPFLEDVLRLELAMIDLAEIRQHEVSQTTLDQPLALLSDSVPRLSPRYRLLVLAHDPGELLPPLKAGQLPQDVSAGEYWLLLGWSPEYTLDMSLLDPAIGGLLAACDGQRSLAALCADWSVEPEELEELVGALEFVAAPAVVLA